ncbi:ORF6N domain-containing protein [Candidatus Peregrinibacteria bacterium]|nr:ORF6N domain-containing protein [Candidatus Peregrinibacteria bacterium]
MDRFPDDFAFQLTNEEWGSLRSQFATSNLMFQIGTSSLWGGRRKSPRVFTEHGAYAAAFVLRSPRAQKMSIEVIRAFIRMRQLLASQEGLSKDVKELKSFVLKHSNKTDREFRRVWQAIEKLSAPPPVEERRIGFCLE